MAVTPGAPQFQRVKRAGKVPWPDPYPSTGRVPSNHGSELQAQADIRTRSIGNRASALAAIGPRQTHPPVLCTTT